MTARFRSTLHHSLLIGTLFGVIFFCKLWVIKSWSSSVPFWDQWDAEGLYLLNAWKEGTLRWSDFFSAHNEHRILLTRVTALLLTTLNGQWDPRMEMVYNAAVHALFAVLVWIWLLPRLTRPWHFIVTSFAIALAAAPPHSWQNVINGFHSQQYYLIAFGLIGIDSTLRGRPLSAQWWCGVTSLILGIFSMGTGFFAAAVVLAGCFLKERGVINVIRRHTVTLVTCALLTLLGVLLRQVHPGHEGLVAQSFRDFFLTFWRALQWPLMTTWLPFGLLAYLPWLALAVTAWRKRGEKNVHPKDLVLVTTGIWQLLQIAALAYARGAGGPWPGPRYVDTIVTGILVNFLSALVYCTHYAQPGAVLRRIGQLAFVVWCAGIIVGLSSTIRWAVQNDGPWLKNYFAEMEHSVRLYLGTGDAAWLHGPQIPYPDAAILEERLKLKSLVALLPTAVRPARIPIEEKSIGFSPSGLSPKTHPLVSAPTWGSYQSVEQPSEWLSRPITPPPSGFLKFELAGDAPSGGPTLELWSEDLKSRIAVITPSKPLQSTWRATYVPTPNQPFRIVAKDNTPGAWMAFSAPVEMPTGSYWTYRLIQHAPLAFWLCLSGLAGCWLAILFGIQNSDKRDRAPL